MDWTESNYSERTAMRFARAGASVRVIAADDACAVCKAKSATIYTPSEVPRLPIRGCRNEQCRCRFEAVDPETELTVSQWVERGVHALKAGRHDLARQILQHAVALDEMHELGWLWLSAVAVDQDKIACLEKVLAINPRNRNAQAGLESLRSKLGTPEPTSPPQEQPPLASRPELGAEAAAEPVPEKEETAPEPLPEEEEIAPEPMPEDRAQPTAPLPAELVMARTERRVIIEQWAEFSAFALEIDPQMLLMQAGAFLAKIQQLNQQARAILADEDTSPELELDELYLQWQESEEIGETLAEAIEQHQSHDPNTPGWTPIRDALHGLAQMVLSHRNQLRETTVAAGGEPPA